VSTGKPFSDGSGTPIKSADPIPRVVKLLAIAKHALEHKRLKHSADVVNDILRIDPFHEEALQIQSEIQSQLKRDLAKARVLLSASGETYEEFLIKKARSLRQRRLYSRAEDSLNAILEVEPENGEARNLLSLVASLQQVAKQPVPRKPRGRLLARAVDVVSRGRMWLAAGVLVLLGLGGAFWFGTRGTGASGGMKAEEVPDTQDSAEAGPLAPNTGSLRLFVAPAQGVRISVNNAPATPVRDSLQLKAGTHQLRFTADGYAPQTRSEKIIAGETRPLVIILKSSSGAKAPPPNTSATRSSPAPPAPREAAVTAATGTLSLNAQVPVDVYMKGKYLGRTPLRVQLPSGAQTLEARYQDLRKNVSYTITSNETTTATVAFDVTLQINANPWAAVFIEGTPAKSLGETPLSGMSVPVGSVLVFKHPTFPDKRIRVTGKESSVQVVFP